MALAFGNDRTWDGKHVTLDAGKTRNISRSVCLLNGLGWVGLGENLSVRTLRNVYVLQAFFIPQTEDFVSIADESPKILGLEDGSEQETKC